MSNRATELRRLQATAQDHIYIDQPRCVYCGADSIRPLFQPSGRTRHLDHFIPVEIVIRVRQRSPLSRIPNWLLPCCPRCNNIAGQYLFSSFGDKFNFVQSRLRHQALWRLTDNPRQDQLKTVRVSKEVLDAIKPMDQFRRVDYIILLPHRLTNGLWDASQIAERAL
jgi:hypothetical protein